MDVPILLSSRIDELRAVVSSLEARTVGIPVAFGVDALDGRLSGGGLMLNAVHDVAPGAS